MTFRVELWNKILPETEKKKISQTSSFIKFK